ncbi:MAG TPA: NAD-dependent epimerase/dehydratase family protein [Oscillospiraceae bacterium]|nr:NAD-dependent epimerase/dehydratase family protein [Oscillospiraceae bacterium]
MDTLYIVTGAAGHLGSAVVRALSARGDAVRALVHQPGSGTPLPGVRYSVGDVTLPATLRPLFADTGGRGVIVIHAAGMVSIAEKVTPRLYEVNVNGTKNVLAACRDYGVRRLVYVSSVHAISEVPDGGVIRETDRFSPDTVEGAYAKTKAEATRAVLDAAAAGLDAVVVHPSGIIGPYDSGKNHLVQMIADYITGRLPAGVMGGYDFVDVRDVAEGCLLAAEKGIAGQCYILTNRYCSVRDLFGYIRLAVRGPRKLCLPIWLASGAAPLLEGLARLARRRPLYTRYALHTLRSNGIFSHDKATAELGYRPRDLKDTVADTVSWLKAGTGP